MNDTWNVRLTPDSKWQVFNTVTGVTWMTDGSESIANFYARELNMEELAKIERVTNDNRIAAQGIGF